MELSGLIPAKKKKEEEKIKNHIKWWTFVWWILSKWLMAISLQGNIKFSW